MYVELHTASAFSFLEAASSPEALVERAASLGYPALALLDRDGVYGAPRFHMAAKQAGLKAIIGAELTIKANGVGRAASPKPPAGQVPKPPSERGAVGDRALPGTREPGSESRESAWQSPHPPFLWRLPVLVSSREGYKNLCRLITRMKLAAPKGEGSLQLEDLEGYTSGLVALTGRAALTGQRYGVGGLLDRLVGLFGRSQVYVELQRHLHRDEETDNQVLRTLASAFGVPILATNGVRFTAPADRPLYDVLTCVRHKTTLTRAGQKLARNAEHYLKSPAQMARLFDDLPEAVTASHELAAKLEYTMADLGYRFPEYPVPPGETAASFLRKVTEVGACERYRPFHDRARAQIARELDLIEKLDLAGYFLIVWDLVNFCRQHAILVQGRGSAANSAVCYSLGITAVDPVEMELLFERFLSAERGEWPDIDLDLPSGDRREEVIQYVYERYGKLGAAMTANVITYRGRSAAREVGKALDLESAEVDRLAKIMHTFEWRDPKETIVRNLRDAGLDPDDARFQQFAGLWREIQHLPRHLGQHSGGMVICQGRLDEIVPLENAAMPGRVVIQWDKDDCADMGLVKVDLLGLGMMAVLQDALAIVNNRAPGSGLQVPAGDKSQVASCKLEVPGARSLEPGAWSESREPGAESLTLPARSPEPGARNPSPSHPAVIDLAHLPHGDPHVYRMLCEADTIGIFQVESRAQMATLPRLRPSCFYDLVVEVAIIRPGPIVGQMVHPYLKRRKGDEPVSYPHPSLEPVLKRTLGVPLFQEQLLRIAMVAADFSGGEAEELRRAMGFKRSEERMQKIEVKLRTGMARNGIVGEEAERILLAITSFALYGFPESHAASFALIVYASAYLKVYFPAAFYTAMLNNQPMGFYHPATLVKDAQRRGVRFLSIDVQWSRWDCQVEDGGAIRLGLRYVQGLREEVGRAIESQKSEVKSQKSDEAGATETYGGRGFSLADPEARSPEPGAWLCPKCGNDDERMVERDASDGTCFCNLCAHAYGGMARVAEDRPDSAWMETATYGGRDFSPADRIGPGFSRTDPGARSLESGAWSRFTSIDHFIAVTKARRDELATLAEVGALNAFGHDRREALWQIERAVRPTGELFEPARDEVPATAMAPAPRTPTPQSPLQPMTPIERVIADYEGTGLTIGPHPMSLRRPEMALRGVLRAIELPRARAGRRVRVAGAVITRQRPGTAKGFVFLTLEDETGIANVIVRPDLFDVYRVAIIGEPFLLVEGVLQQQDAVTSIRAERVFGLGGESPAIASHDFR